jgi:hypothetical protein
MESPEELEQRRKEAQYLWSLTDSEIADECSRYSYVYAAQDPLLNRLAVLFEANRRILQNQLKILEAINANQNIKEKEP